MPAAAAATPSLWEWSFDPPVCITIAFALLYWVGSRRTVTPRRTRAAQRRRSVWFYAGVATLILALASPLDALSEQLFWAHMTQHVLLLVVAPPLIVLARPWIRLWRVLPLDARRSVGGWISHSRRAAPLRGVSRSLGGPTASFVLFSVVLLGWHLPSLFDATLRSSTLHGVEHTLFFSTALMFWKQVIDSPPLRARLSAPERVVYVIGAMIVSWVLAIVLALAPHPLYAPYAHAASRAGGISAIADQQIAAGIMWVPGSITFVIVIFAYINRWLAPVPVVARASQVASTRS